jgi:hypothetical protein
MLRSGHILLAAAWLCGFLCMSLKAEAQAESPSRQPADSVFRFFTTHPSPKRAALYSALLPGLGQVYNRQYWKTGVVYAGMGVIAGFMVSNVRQYRYYHKVYIGRIDADPATTDTLVQYSNDDINTLRKGYRTYTEYTAIAGTLAYLLNILDAYVSAHLKTFDMSRDISFRAMPMLNEQRQPALRVTLALK